MVFLLQNIRHDKAKRIRPMTFLLKQGVKFVFAPAIEAIVRELHAELSTPPVLVDPNWDAVTDDSRPFLIYRDASVDSFGTTLERELDDHTICTIVFISRATIESERNWTLLDLEDGSIVWSISVFAVICGVPFSAFFPDHKALKRVDKIAELASTAMAVIPYRLQLHSEMSQRKCQREL